jgi:hypothetical protein
LLFRDDFPEKGKADFLDPPHPFAFRHHLSALIRKITTVGNRPVGRVQKNLSFLAEPFFGHLALPDYAGGSAIGLSATDAYGQSLGR